MKKMKYILLFCLVCFFAGCNAWLDVKPLGQVEEDKMFSDEKGFLQTLTGTYTLLGDQSVYGEELTIGFVDEIVRYWKENSKFYDFNYQDADVVKRLDASWKQLYKAIANVNLLLKNLEKKDKSEFDNYDLIKGEALGLRAYLHLDLLRLFGPVLKNGLNQLSVPYREEFSNNMTQRLTAAEVLGKIERDLLAAYTLLQDDPVKTYGRTYSAALKNKDLAFGFRGIRMNYYAVCATLARMYQLKNDNMNALKYANEILDATSIFQLLKREDIVADVSKQNLMFERELIWAIYDQKLEQKLVKSIANLNYAADLDFRDFVYTGGQGYGSVEDYRKAYLWKEIKLSTSIWTLGKYDRMYEMNTSGSTERTDKTPWKKLLPMIRLSEIYYIAAESNLETNTPEAFRLINEVRKSRNLTPLPDQLKNEKSVLADQIIYEYQKDYWGEGKLFYMYKRLFHDIIQREGNIPASKSLFELPLPKDEIEFGGN